MRLYYDLFKLRIGLVIGLTAVAGVFITPGPAVAGWRVLALALAVTLSSAAAGAYNQYAERDLDGRMRRTSRRAFVTGRLQAGPAWLFTIAAMAGAGVGLAALAVNPVAALYTLLGAFTYAIVYTRWLKRLTAWNIVVGGLAGSFAVLAGGAAVVPLGLQPLTLVFAVVLFLWTPPHFWSLAIAYREDYAAAGVPMLPVVVGEARAARAILLGALLLVVASLLPAWFGLGALYLVVTLAASGYLLSCSWRLLRAPGRAAAMANFRASLVYLVLVIGAAVADALLAA